MRSAIRTRPSIPTRSTIPTILSVLLLFALDPAAPATAQDGFDPGLYDVLSWRNLGPARGGRSTAAAGSEARPLEYFFGATGGGLWRTTDGGTTWEPVTDGQIGSASVGAVAVCVADPDVVYIGTGETQLRGNVQQGDGVYRSTDGGDTWEHVGLTETQNVSRILVDPRDCGTAWVAAFGKHSAPNPERGVFKTTDGGESWRRVLFRDELSGAVDLTHDPANPDLMYASLWEAWRRSWALSSGGPGSGLFRSTDGGETWEEVTRNPGLPEGVLGKIGVDVSPADPDRVYAMIEAEEGGVYRSDDGGATWTRTNEERKLRQRAFYYTRIYADPVDVDRVYVLNVGMFRSDDGGETFDEQISVPHGDNHDLWIAPDDNLRMINANDGGANVSFNGGETWTDQDYATAQFYRVTTTAHQPYHVCGAQQDNSTACVPSRDWSHLSRHAGGPEFLYAVGGCESGHIAPHPVDTDLFYAGCYGGSMTEYDHSSGRTRPINVWPENPMGQSAEDLVERVQWNFPIVFSPHDPGVLYTGTQRVWRTTDRGMSWERISHDLTLAVDSTLGPSGGPITKDQTGVETFATVFAIAPSPHDARVLWAGSDDGLVHVTRDGGSTWSDVTPPDAPYLVRINTIEASPHAPGRAYVSGIRYLVEDDRSPYVWKTEDWGETWETITDGIARDHFVRAVREDPVRPGLLYAGTEETVYVSWSDGDRWHPLGLNLPNVQVSDVAVREDDLVIATHGRSFWILEGLGLLRELTPETASAPVHLFQPTDPVLGVEDHVEVHYHLARDAGEVTVTFLDPDGNELRSFIGRAEEDEGTEGDEETDEADEEEAETSAFASGDPGPGTEVGSHRFRWDLRTEAWTDFESRIFWSARPMGPRVPPGAYTVRLTVDGRTLERDFRVTLDPRIDDVTREDLEERFRLGTRIRDEVSRANEAVLRIRGIREALDDRLGRTDDPTVESLARDIRSSLSEVEAEIYQVRNESRQDPLNFPIRINNKIAALLGFVEGGDAAPPRQAYTVFDHLRGQLDEQIGRMEAVLDGDLVRLNDALRAEGLETIDPEPVGM